ESHPLLRRDRRVVADALRGRDGDGYAGAVGAFGLAGRVDGDEGGVGTDQAVLERQRLDLSGQVGGGAVPGGGVGEVGDLGAGPDGAEGAARGGRAPLRVAAKRGVEVHRDGDGFTLVADLAGDADVGDAVAGELAREDYRAADE